PDAERRRPAQEVLLRAVERPDVLALAREPLQAVVLAVGDEDGRLRRPRVDDDLVGRVELAGLARVGALAAPGRDVLAARGVAVDVVRAVAVRHVDVLAGDDRDAGRLELVLRFVDPRGLRIALHPHDLARGGQLRELVPEEAHEVEELLAPLAVELHVVRAVPGLLRLPLLAERAHELAGGVEHDDRGVAVRAEVDLVLAVHHDAAVHAPVLRARGQRSPPADPLVTVCAGTQRHGFSPLGSLRRCEREPWPGPRRRRSRSHPGQESSRGDGGAMATWHLAPPGAPAGNGAVAALERRRSVARGA